MTLDGFLVVLAECKDQEWKLNVSGCIRNKDKACPIIAVYQNLYKEQNVRCDEVDFYAKKINLSDSIADQIIYASDQCVCHHEVRKQMMEILEINKCFSPPLSPQV